MNVCGNSVLFKAVNTFDLKKKKATLMVVLKEKSEGHQSRLRTMNVCTALHNSPFNSWTFLFVSISAVSLLLSHSHLNVSLS